MPIEFYSYFNMPFEKLKYIIKTFLDWTIANFTGSSNLLILKVLKSSCIDQ
ncbi:hypothetical protein H8356DRAFT_1436398 [Neocallimastix lanati (nom. inval.)]|nr:hypothetical protein H8356DRAFT_1436398 [Neocallimastix sp. JGI-2020a]